MKPGVDRACTGTLPQCLHRNTHHLPGDEARVVAGEENNGARHLFFLIILPFYWIAWRRMGRKFTLKTFAAVATLSVLTEFQPLALRFESIHPLYAAVMGGLLMGAGFLMLFRHRASLGGVGIVALVLQQERGWRAGKVQMAVDCAIVLAALFVVDPKRIGFSLVGAVVLNLTLAVNHKPGRYIAM